MCPLSARNTQSEDSEFPRRALEKLEPGRICMLRSEKLSREGSALGALSSNPDDPLGSRKAPNSGNVWCKNSCFCTKSCRSSSFSAPRRSASSMLCSTRLSRTSPVDGMASTSHRHETFYSKKGASASLRVMDMMFLEHPHHCFQFETLCPRLFLPRGP